MANHALPTVDSLYVDYTAQIKDRLEDQAKGFDPANTTATNITIGTIRWNSAENKDQKWTGTAWVDKSSNYVFNGITLSGGTANGVAYLNGSKVLTTGSALTFDGTTLGSNGNSNGANIEVLKLSNIGSGDNTQASVGFYAAGTKYSEIIGGYSGAPSLKYNVATTIGYHQWQINNSEQMRLTSTGLGIGTSSPSNQLDISNSNDPTASFYRTSSNPSAGVGRLFWDGQNSVGSRSTYARIQAEIVTNTAGSHAGQLIFSTTTNGALTTKMTLDASGNLGLGATPSAWGGGYGPVLEMKAGGSLVNNQPNNVHVANNCYYNGTNWIYKSTNAASRYEQFNGLHAWLIAPSGTAGNTISFTQAMTLDANGNLGIGTSSPSQKLHVSGNTFVTIGSSYFSYTSDFGFGTPDFDGLQVFAGGGDKLRFGHRTSGAFTERMRLDANGKLILSAANQGIQFADGTTQTTASSAGTYTPTITLNDTGASVSANSAFMFTKVGNIVTVYGQVLFAKTTSSFVSGTLSISLPLNKPTSGKVCGVAQTNATTFVSGTPAFYGTAFGLTFTTPPSSAVNAQIALLASSGYSGSVWLADVSFSYSVV